MNKRFGGVPTVAARCLAVVVAVLASACSDSSGPGSRTVSTLKIGTGDKLVACAGSTLKSPVSFTAVDDHGRAVSGVIVAFAVTGGNGSLAADRDTSDGSGNVTAQWTVGPTAGQAQELTATVVSSTSIAPAQAHASVIAGPASALAGTVAGVSARAGDAVGALTVGVRDKFGNAVAAPNVRVTVRLENAAGTTLGGTTSSTTDANGSAVFTNLSTTGKAGALTLLFESDGLAAARVPLTLAGGQPAKITNVTSATIDAEALLSGPAVSAKVLDAFDNPVAGAGVSFSIEGNALGSVTTGNDGVATLSSWIVPQIGAYKLVASATGVATPAQFTLNALTVTAKTLAGLTTNPTNGVVGHAVVLSVLAIDGIGRPVPNAPLTWTLGGVDRQVTTDGSGVATFLVELPTKSGNNPILVRATPTTSVTLNIEGLPGALATAVPEKDSVDVPAGSTVGVRFIAQDSYGNPVPNVSLPAYISVNLGPFQTLNVTSDASGIATVPATLDPFAGVLEFAVFDAVKHSFVHATADRGAVRISNAPCVKSVNAGTTTVVQGLVFGPNGRVIGGIPVTWTTASGNGQMSTVSGPISLQSSLIVVSGTTGGSSVQWFVPQQIGTYAITAQGPTGYDLPASVTFSCSVN
jgi:hypothetical protein